ncbi:MAG: TetR/AcrR family transcriptional regulator [Dysgonamonadaceae bacterium]|jgi:AcrR family transcriptional regulator|nr:TetR/AcrR family transcriptional regulator [Dysgonamonadaceae bacterium]
MAKNTKEKLYEEAFRLFLNKPYELVTVRELEKAIGMTRGAIFYYVKDKEQLFREVIEKYFLKHQNLHNKIGNDNLDYKMSLKNFIDVFITAIEKTVDEIYRLAGVDKKIADKKNLAEIDRNYLSLALLSGHYLDDFYTKIEDMLLIDRNTWTFFVQQAIVNGEVKPSINPRLYGELFTYVYLGASFQDAFNSGINTRNLKELFMILYNQIKV